MEDQKMVDALNLEMAAWGGAERMRSTFLSIFPAELISRLAGTQQTPVGMKINDVLTIQTPWREKPYEIKFVEEQVPEDGKATIENYKYRIDGKFADLSQVKQALGVPKEFLSGITGRGFQYNYLTKGTYQIQIRGNTAKHPWHSEEPFNKLYAQYFGNIEEAYRLSKKSKTKDSSTNDSVDFYKVVPRGER